MLAPDGIESYEDAKTRMDTSTGFPVLNIRDIIDSKRAARRAKDAIELPLLEAFREVYEMSQRSSGATSTNEGDNFSGAK